MTTPTAPCQRCGRIRFVRTPHKYPYCMDCARFEDTPAAEALPPGNWRLDPFTGIQRYVSIEPLDRSDPEPKKTRADCGTISGPARHRRHGEKPCEACLVAHAEYARERYNARKAA